MAANQNPNRKSESIRRANRIIQTRSFVLMILMGVVMFVLLFFRLFDLQITRHEELQSKAVNHLRHRRQHSGYILQRGDDHPVPAGDQQRAERHRESRDVDEGLAGGGTGGDTGQGRRVHPQADGQREIPV